MNTCDHRFDESKVKEYIGPNIFGKIVKCYGRDLYCWKCSTLSWKRAEKEKL